jgi:hypothetical protein
MEEDMQKRQKIRAKFEKLLEPSARWRRVDSHDVFSLPPIPPGKTEYLEFDPNVLPPNISEHQILDNIWDDEMMDAFISDMKMNGDWRYGKFNEKHWELNKGLSNISIGLMLLIRADNSARSSVIDLIGNKVIKNKLSETVEAAHALITSKWPQFKSVVPGQDFLRRFIANCRFSTANETLLSRKFTNCIFPGFAGRRMAADEKGAKFTGNDKDLVSANKPEGIVVSWTADVALETRHNESFLVHVKTHHSDPTGPQSIWNEYYSIWCELFVQIANESTVQVTDAHYMCNEVLEKVLDKGITFMSGFDSNKFRSLTAILEGVANKASEWAALYNQENNLLLMKRTKHDGKTKFCISNYMVHSRGHPKQSDLHQWDAYDQAYYLVDQAHQQIMIRQHRRWPFRHGSNGHPGMQSHVFDILWCFIIENVRVSYRALHTPDIERPKYAPFLASLAFHLIEKGLRQLMDSA